MKKKHARSPSQRQLRVGEEIRHSLAHIMGRQELRDPDIAGVSITVTEVRASADLRNATVFVAPLGGGDAAPVMAALKRATPYLRRRVGAEVKLKFVPNLVFEEDRSFDYASRIERLIEEADRGA